MLGRATNWCCIQNVSADIDFVINVLFYHFSFDIEITFSRAINI